MPDPGTSLPLAGTSYDEPWESDGSQKRLVLDVSFETAEDYDISSVSKDAVRGWSTIEAEGKMEITWPSTIGAHRGRFGMEARVQPNTCALPPAAHRLPRSAQVRIITPYARNSNAQMILPYFIPRTGRSAYQLAFWGRVARGGDEEATPQVAFIKTAGYSWVGGAEVRLTSRWQHFALEPVLIHMEDPLGHPIQISFMLGSVAADFFFDDIRLYELESPPPPAAASATLATPFAEPDAVGGALPSPEPIDDLLLIVDYMSPPPPPPPPPPSLPPSLSLPPAALVGGLMLGAVLVASAAVAVLLCWARLSSSRRRGGAGGSGVEEGAPTVGRPLPGRLALRAAVELAQRTQQGVRLEEQSDVTERQTEKSSTTRELLVVTGIIKKSAGGRAPGRGYEHCVEET